MRIALHNLWVERVLWKRQYIVAAEGDHPDASFAEELVEIDDRTMSRYCSSIPLLGASNPEEIAGVGLMLASDYSSSSMVKPWL